MTLLRAIIFFSLLCLLTTYGVLVAQEPVPIEWGEIPTEQLALSSFPQDSNATALILCDYGESYLGSDLNTIYKRHRRIKILTNAGFDWGTHSVAIHTKDKTENISSIEGVTYSLNAKGKIVETEMDDDAIFREDVDGDNTRIRFTLPALVVGCVIEYRYTITADDINYLRDWSFQTSEPVLWSEYRLTTPVAISYASVVRGFEPFAAMDNTVINRSFSGVTSSYLGTQFARCNHRRWAVKNAPAIRNEPFVTTTDDYINKVFIQLAGYAFPGGGKRQVLKDWETVVQELRESLKFGRMIDVTGDIERTAEKATAGLTTAMQKVRAVYDFVRSTIVWSEEHRVFANKEVDDVLESKTGNSAEMTFLLLSMLKSVGIDAAPVIVSTRANGAVQRLYPIVSQFNSVIVMATIEGKQYFLDATDRLRPMDLVPRKILNVQGLVIQEGPVSWVTVSSPKLFVHKSVASIVLDADGVLAGTMESLDGDYSALEKRRELSGEDKKEIDIVKNAFESDEVGIQVDSVAISGRDSIDGPLRLWAQVSSDQYVNVSGDLMYINPLVLDRKRENPLALPVRKFPVDMAHGTRITTVVNLTLPAGFVLKEGFNDRVVTLRPEEVSYTRKMTVENSRIQILSDLTIRRSYFPPNEYNALRNFYAQVIALQNEQLVLQRTATGTK